MPHKFPVWQSAAACQGESLKPSENEKRESNNVEVYLWSISRWHYRSKTSGKAVKTAEQTARTSIKTSKQTANASVQAMHYSMKKAEKAVQTARQTARDTTIAVKKTAKAVTHAIKALIEATKALLSALTAGGWIAVMILIIVILFGGFLCMTGGDNSSTVSSVSAEVEAYEPLIRQYANQYGIGEYVELIKAIMMQESGGRGLDPMQCSEGSFNTIQNIPDSQMESQIQSIRFLVVCRK